MSKIYGYARISRKEQSILKEGYINTQTYEEAYQQSIDNTENILPNSFYRSAPRTRCCWSVKTSFTGRQRIF